MLACALDHKAPDDVMRDHCLHMLHTHHLHQRLIVQITHLRHYVSLHLLERISLTPLAEETNSRQLRCTLPSFVSSKTLEGLTVPPPCAMHRSVEAPTYRPISMCRS